jgi:WD40 repeat protein
MSGESPNERRNVHYARFGRFFHCDQTCSGSALAPVVPSPKCENLNAHEAKVVDNHLRARENRQHSFSGLEGANMKLRTRFPQIAALFLVAWLLLPLSSAFSQSKPQRFGEIHAVAFTPDGRQVVVSGYDGVCLCDIATGVVMHRYESKQTRVVVALVVSPDGRRVLATLNGAGAKEDQYGLVLWDIGGAEIRRFLGHEGYVNAVAFSSDGRAAVSASSDGTVAIWEVDSGRRLQTLIGHKGDVNQVVVSPDGKTVISAGGDYWHGKLHDPSVRVWDFNTGKLLRTMTNGETAVHYLALSRDGGRLAFGGNYSHYHSIRVMETQNWTELPAISLAEDLQSLAFSPSGDVLLTSSGFAWRRRAEFLDLWDVNTGRNTLKYFSHTSVPHCVAFSPDGKLAVTGHGYYDRPPADDKRIGDLFNPTMRVALYDDVVRVWDVEKGTIRRKIDATGR